MVVESIIGAAVLGSVAASTYEKVDHHLYNKINSAVGKEIFEVEDKNKPKNTQSEKTETKINIDDTKVNKCCDIEFFHIVAMLSVALFATYGTYKIMDNLKKR